MSFLLAGPLASLGLGAAPTISDVSVRGLQAGAVTSLTIKGTGLSPTPRILLPIPVAEHVVRAGGTDKQVQIDLTLPADAPVGIVQMRLVNAEGISNAVAISVDGLPQAKFTDKLQDLPVAVNGTIRGTQILRTTIEGKAGERIVAEVEARRLGSALNPVLHLYDERRVQAAWAQGVTSLGGDARLEAVIPSDGRFTLELHDALYRGGDPGFFRLKVGDLQYAELAYPLGVRRGTAGSVNLIGANLPPDSKTEVQARSIGDVQPAVSPADKKIASGAPRVVISDLNEILEQAASGDALQQVTAPAAINGRLGAAGEEDRYRIAVRPGMRLRFDLLASRAGSPLDAVLSIRDEAGKELAKGDDGPDSVDPAVNFAVPKGARAVVVGVRDLLGRGGDDYVYRLAISQAGQPDFTLELFEDRHQTPQLGTAVVRVRTARAGYRGPIRLDFEGLPEGIAVANNEIPADATDALVTLIGAGPNPGAIVTRIVGHAAPSSPSPGTPGEGRGEGRTRPRVALLPENQVSKPQPWLREELAIALTTPAPLQVAWVSESAEAKLPVGYSLASRVAATRKEGLAGQLRLSLLTSQIIPKKNIMVRRQQRQVDDLERALRLDGTPSIAADQSIAEVKLLVPADLPLLAYDVAIKAELLSEDGKKVLATAVTPARRLMAVAPVRLQLAHEPKVEAKAGGGVTGKLTGTVTRAAGFNEPVTLTLTGLPAELPPPVVDLAADEDRFELDVAFPYGSKLGELSNVKLAALRPDTSQPLAGTEIPVTVNIVQGEPPAPVTAPLHKLFEDERQVVSLLSEGKGQVTLERLDRYSGASALRVTADQRYRAQMPGWGFKIKENPGEGEFRYLRFAWKKSGGDNILLQLSTGGKFGPQRGKGGPSFRYEAGPAENTFNAAALRVSKQLPRNWEVVTRDLFADFGEFQLDGVALTPGPGEYGLFDHIYLARSESDFDECPPPLAPERPLAVFEDDSAFVTELKEGGGEATLETAAKYTGTASLKVTPDQKYSSALSNLSVKIRRNPGPGEYRFLTFAWRKRGGSLICLQLNHDGKWGPTDDNPAEFRYDAGSGEESYGAAVRVDVNLPTDFVVVTRDLFADFGEFTLTGLGFSPQDGDHALFDHIYLGRSPRDFELVRPGTAVASGR
jgi:hypothetical protein